LGLSNAPSISLDRKVRKCDIDVMTSHTGHEAGPASPFFPPAAPAATAPTATATSLKARVAAVNGLSRAELQGASVAQLRGTLEQLLGALKNVPAADLQLGERHADGSLGITSHIAVWLIGQVVDGYGSKLVRLSKVSNKDTLRSLDGLAGLLAASIATKKRKAS
jgi:hypothetical protein